ncbi:MAG TPA: hypothetical protein VF006_23125 [Longimicrobium sp.]
MERIASDRRRAFFLRVIEPDEAPEPPFGGEPYAALVWAARRTSDAQKQRTAQALIASGCRYVVCGGVESDAWEDAADGAYLEQDLPEPVPHALFVTTTSHRGEPEDEVVFFLINNTSAGGHGFSRYLVLLIGADDGVRERLTAAVRAQVAGLHPPA